MGSHLLWMVVSFGVIVSVEYIITGAWGTRVARRVMQFRENLFLKKFESKLFVIIYIRSQTCGKYLIKHPRFFEALYIYRQTLI